MDPKDNPTNPVPSDEAQAPASQAPTDNNVITGNGGDGSPSSNGSTAVGTNPGADIPSLASEEPAASADAAGSASVPGGLGGDTQPGAGAVNVSPQPSPGPAATLDTPPASPPGAIGANDPSAPLAAEAPQSPDLGPDTPASSSTAFGPDQSPTAGVGEPSAQSDVPATAPVSAPASDKRTFLILVVVAVVLVAVAAFLFLQK